MRFMDGHWQNLNEDRRGRVKGSILRHGRMWIKLFGLNWHWEWTLLGKPSCGIGITFFSNDTEISWMLQVPFLFSFYGGVNGVIPKKWQPTAWDSGRDTSIRIFDWKIWIHFWQNDMCWSSKDDWWHSVTIDPVRILLGRDKHSKELLDEADVQFALPERIYKVNIKLFESQWKRPRWFVRKLLTAEITPEPPIPVPGKGENSWDCGQDATHALYCPASNFSEAMAELYKTVLRSRERHGGLNWKPEETKV